MEFETVGLESFKEELFVVRDGITDGLYIELEDNKLMFRYNEIYAMGDNVFGDWNESVLARDIFKIINTIDINFVLSYLKNNSLSLTDEAFEFNAANVIMAIKKDLNGLVLTISNYDGSVECKRRILAKLPDDSRVYILFAPTYDSSIIYGISYNADDKSENRTFIQINCEGHTYKLCGLDGEEV